MWSDTYQWLPANVALRENGGCELTSYVNNLHPTKYPDIYHTIERAIGTAIPAWDQCLQEFLGYRKQVVPGRHKSRFEKIREAS